MQSLPIDRPLHRVTLQGNNSPETLRLALGQQLAATVLKTADDGQTLLGIEGQKVWARSEFPLAEGQRLQLRVQQNETTVELQLLDTITDDRVENHELAAVAKAVALGRGAPVPEPDLTRLLEAVQQLLKQGGPWLTEPQNRQLHSLLQPMTAGPDAKALLPQIQNALQNSGLFFEAKVRAILEALRVPAETALATVGSDLKVLLGQLRQLLPAFASPTGQLPGSSSDHDHTTGPLFETGPPAQHPENRNFSSEPATLLARSAEPRTPIPAETPLRQPAATVLEQSAALASEVLSRQTQAAFEWIASGSVHAELPVQFGGHSTRARIRIFRERDNSTARHSRRPLNVAIHLDLPSTGRLEAWARWEGTQIQATLYVRDTATRELFEPHLAELAASLREAGFSTAALDLRVDPVRLYRTQPTNEQAFLQEGAVLSLRV